MHCTDNLALRQAAHVVNFLHSSVLFADSYFKKKKKNETSYASGVLSIYSITHEISFWWMVDYI